MNEKKTNMDWLTEQIARDKDNLAYTQAGILPLYAVFPTAKIAIVGQAPGIVAQQTRLSWNDRSGNRLREWLDIDRETFYYSGLIAILAMDFYYPGKGQSGDLPPRKGFAAKWHPILLQQMPHIELMILVGRYAQQYYLGNYCFPTLTETVKHFQDYLPQYFPLVHPSARNQLWLKKNPWFERELLPILKNQVHTILFGNKKSIL